MKGVCAACGGDGFGHVEVEGHRGPCAACRACRAYTVTVAGQTFVYCASTRDRARYLALRDAARAGWGSVRVLMRGSRAVRVPELDVVAAVQGEGVLR